jgi:hypothetical protein
LHVVLRRGGGPSAATVQIVIASCWPARSGRRATYVCVRSLRLAGKSERESADLNESSGGRLDAKPSIGRSLLAERRPSKESNRRRRAAIVSGRSQAADISTAAATTAAHFGWIGLPLRAGSYKASACAYRLCACSRRIN